MAVPDLKSATLVIEPERATIQLTGTSEVQIIGAVATGYAYFLEQISCSNAGSVSANVSIRLREGSSAGTDFDICTKRTLQVKSQFNAAQGRAHILTEGDSLYGKLEASGSVYVVIPYTKAHVA